jgi:hypothetical protein
MRDSSSNSLVPPGFGPIEQPRFGRVRIKLDYILKRGDPTSYGGSGNQAGRVTMPLNIEAVFKRMTKINQMGEH